MACHKALHGALERSPALAAEERQLDTDRCEDMCKERTIGLFKDAVTILIQAGVTVGEIPGVAGLEAPAVEISATKVDGDGN